MNGPAVFTFNTEDGIAYQVQQSPDNATWRNRSLIQGDGLRAAYTEPYDEAIEYFRAVTQ